MLVAMFSHLYRIYSLRNAFNCLETSGIPGSNILIGYMETVEGLWEITSEK